MRSPHLKQAAAAAALLAMPLSLAACSSGGSGNVATAPRTSTTASAPRTTTGSAPSSDTGKPTRAEVATGMTNYFVGKGVPRSLVHDVTTCVADKGYSRFSDATLRALKHGKVNELDPLDAGTLTTVTTSCLASGAVPTVG